MRVLVHYGSCSLECAARLDDAAADANAPANTPFMAHARENVPRALTTPPPTPNAPATTPASEQMAG